MRRSLLRLATRFRPEDEELLLRVAASPEPISRAETLHVAMLSRAGAPDQRYVPWHVTSRVLLCNARWSSPRMEGDVFVSEPVDGGTVEAIDGVAMIDAYAQRQLETVGNLGLRLTGPDTSRELLMVERLKDASHGIKRESRRGAVT